jgi:hypothetical protein
VDVIRKQIKVMDCGQFQAALPDLLNALFKAVKDLMYRDTLPEFAALLGDLIRLASQGDGRLVCLNSAGEALRAQFEGAEPEWCAVFLHSVVEIVKSSPANWIQEIEFVLRQFLIITQRLSPCDPKVFQRELPPPVEEVPVSYPGILDVRIRLET